MAATRRCSCMLRGQRGGFYPSVMAGLTTTGPYFVTAAFAQGLRLVRNEKKRMASRRRGRGKTRKAQKRDRS